MSEHVLLDYPETGENEVNHLIFPDKNHINRVLLVRGSLAHRKMLPLKHEDDDNEVYAGY